MRGLKVIKKRFRLFVPVFRAAFSGPFLPALHLIPSGAILILKVARFFVLPFVYIESRNKMT